MDLHSVANDGRLYTAGENELVLVDLPTGRSEVLCWPGSSVSREFHQVSHVHPLFSPSGRKVVFTSDAGGKAAVFVVPLETAI